MPLRRLTQETPATAAAPAQDSVDYKASYRALVIQQNDDGTLDVTPTDTRFNSFQNVPCMFGVPGFSVTVQPGSYIFFTFWNGVPGQVYVSSWDPMNSVVVMDVNATTLKLNPGDASYLGKGVARITDSVDLGTFAFNPGSGGATLTWKAPGSTAPPVTIPPTGLDLTGSVSTGHDTVLS